MDSPKGTLMAASIVFGNKIRRLCEEEKQGAEVIIFALDHAIRNNCSEKVIELFLDSVKEMMDKEESHG